MGGIIYSIIRENDNGVETIVEEHTHKATAMRRLEYLRSIDIYNYYYMETR